MSWWLVVVGAAFGQDAPAPSVPEINTQLYRTNFDSRATLWAETAGTIGADGAGARAFVGYLREPLVFVVDDGTKLGVVNDALQLNLLGSYRYDRFRLGVDLPVYLVTTSDLSSGGAGTGDLTVDARVAILDPGSAPIGLSVAARVLAPTASVDTALGASGVGGEVAAILTKDLDALQLNLNLGQRFLPNTAVEGATLDDELFVLLGGGYAVTDAAGISGDLGSTVNYRGLQTKASALPIEVVVGGWGRVSDEFVIRGGLGRGLTPGIGSPAARVLVGLSYEPGQARDSDGDGLVDKEDGCPQDAEDMDQFEDENGCPDLDNDQDGIVDASDGCPLEPEDEDAYDDEDGCPDFSSQVMVSVVDETGAPLTTAEVKVEGRSTEIQGMAGMLASLHDGVYTITATAPDYIGGEARIEVPTPDGGDVVLTLLPAARIGTLEVEVFDPDGQVVRDATWVIDDRAGPAPVDGIATLQTVEGEHLVVVRAPGFGPARVPVTVTKDDRVRAVIVLQPSKVKVTREQINIDETVYFESGKAVIKPESYPLLNEVAQILLDNPDILLVRIEGHTDSRGAATSNQTLSETRAASVLRFLVEQGVAEERLTSVGFGESKPIDPREVAEAWAKNRRVDFFIVRREGQGSSP